jgi:ATP-dependent RNA helicase DeaD
MLGRARVTVTWGDAPSPEEIRKLDTERLLQNPILTEPAGADDQAIAQTLLQSHSPQTIAAAFARLYRAQLPAPEEMPEQSFERKARAPRPPKGQPERETRPSRQERRDDTPAQQRERSPRGGMEGPWFLLNVGRERNADPKWLLPEICRQGGVTKADIGAIRVYDAETRFQVDARVAETFAERVAARQKGGVRIFPAPGNSGEQSPPRSPPTTGAQDPVPEKRHTGKPHAGKKHFGGKPRPGGGYLKKPKHGKKSKPG